MFNGERVLLEGSVPSQETLDYLNGLAVANAKGPATITNRLTIDPSVPLDVPVRVVELQSVRFPSGSTEIRPEHAAELDRVANVMLSLPHVTVHVIGHADQVGNEADNLVLSQLRAEAVVAYLASKGIAPERLTAEGVGETDLILEDVGEDALALNRRTEFVFGGLLIPG
jgi:outer membrane protein OmpA-like peptidoglycan-associated protein